MDALLIINQLRDRYPCLSPCIADIERSISLLKDSFSNGNKLLLCGNGGSASDCEHIVGELMKSFLLCRPLPADRHNKLRSLCPEQADYMIKNLQGALPAISLVSQTSLLTAFANDVAPDMVFAQQVMGYGNEGDILFAISTSGNSQNVLYAALTARVQGMKVISLTGETGGKLKQISDITICAPSADTFSTQEYHLPIYHCICACLEFEFFGRCK